MIPELLRQLRLLTREEEEAGFRRYRVRDPEARCVDQEGYTIAVAYMVSSSELIWKTTENMQIAYKHRQFGTVQGREDQEPKWEPIGTKTYKTPAEAVQQYQFEDAGVLVWVIHPVDFDYREISS